MTVPATLAADLRLLSEVLDSSGADVAATMTVLVSDAALAVPSYLGLSVRLLQGDAPALRITTFQGHPDPGLIGSSLRFLVPGGSAGADMDPPVELVLYAAEPGALIDLAADLAWLTGRELGEFRIDADRHFPVDDGDMSFSSWSTVNQARGVLMGRGLSADEADRELEARAASVGVRSHVAAAALLAALPLAPDQI